MPVLFAQSLGEYGAVGSITSGVQQLAYEIGTMLENVSATTWVIAAGVVVGLWVLFRR